MPRFAHMLAKGMVARGHSVEIRTPQSRASRLPAPAGLRKWLGYVDQFLLFPAAVREALQHDAPDTLYVFTDHALGPWVPLVAHRPHAIHCHDFLAQRSALGDVPENPTSWTGRYYQGYIRRGYSRGLNFISVSQTTRNDLAKFLPAPSLRSEMVYNGLNQHFQPRDISMVRTQLAYELGLDLANGYLLHVGGNQWYKNRQGVLELYNAWRAGAAVAPLPLLLIGEAPSKMLATHWNASPFKADIHWLSGVEDALVRSAYAGATAFIFPSLAEGFGWPIAEAMASGTPVVTTDEAPMTEVGGTAAFYIPRRPLSDDVSAWAAMGAQVIRQVVELNPDQRTAAAAAGLANAQRFEASVALDRIEKIYHDILSDSKA